MSATDDAALCERLGFPVVVVVRGSERALKITDEADFARADALAPLADVDAATRACRSGRAPRWTRRSARRSHTCAGGLLAYPTETVYGFGRAVDLDAVERLVALKRRPPAKPFLLLIAGSEMLARLGSAPNECRVAPGGAALAGAAHAGAAGRRATRAVALRGPEGGVAVRWTSHARAAAPDPARTAIRSRRRAPTGRGFRRRCRRQRLLSSGATPSRAASCSCSTAGGCAARRRRRSWTARGAARA